MRVTFLGTGTSHGVPMIGCACEVCRSTNPRDKRWRPSILLEVGGLAVLVDTSTDLRAQALAFGVTRVDAVLYTHSHADHILGFDELRRFNVLMGHPVPVFGDARTLADLRRVFAYAFADPPPRGGGVPNVRPFGVRGPFCLGGVEVVPVPIRHGEQLILGYRIGPFAYLTDCSGIPDAAWPLLAGVDVVVLGALRDRRHPTHFTVAEAVEAAGRLGARRTLFTHMCHDLGHDATNRRLPAGIELAWDGLVLEVSA